MKQLTLFIAISICINLYSQEFQKKEKKIVRNSLKVYYPIHFYSENEYGNFIIANGIALGLEYTHLFKKTKVSFFINSHVHSYGQRKIGFIPIDKSKINKIYLIERNLAYFSIGFENQMVNYKRLYIRYKYFINYRTGSKTVSLNEPLPSDRSIRSMSYSDFGIGTNLSLNYKILKKISIGLDYSIIGYLYKYKNPYYIHYQTSHLLMYSSIYTRFLF